MARQSKPAKESGELEVLLTVRVEKQTLKDLQASAEKHDRTVSQEVRRALRLYLAKA